MEPYKKAFKSKDGKMNVLKAYNSLLDKWPVPYNAISVDTSYGNTYAIVCGKKTLPPLFLLHGTATNLTMWYQDIKEFSQYFNVYLLDIPSEPGAAILT